MQRHTYHYCLYLIILLLVSACSAQETSQPTINGIEENLLVGTWTEVAQISCQSKSERNVANPIEELIFFEDNTINVTWFPFETYVDYIGRYVIDKNGRIEIVAEELNYLPPELDTSGSYEINEAGRLILMDMWLGVPPLDSAHPVNCGHIFEKR